MKSKHILFATVQFSNTNFTYSFCIAILYISQLFENISKDFLFVSISWNLYK